MSQTEKFLAFLDEIENFVDKVLIPAEEEVSITEKIPDYIIAHMRSIGMFGLSIPSEFGGLGLSISDETEVIFRLGRAAPAFYTYVGTNNGIGGHGIIAGGSDYQKKRYLPKMASGELIGSFALTEETAGSDASAIKTTARKIKDGWVLNGKKRYITNSPVAGLFTVVARIEGTEGKNGITTFLVDADNPGLYVSAETKKMGLQGSPIAEVTFTNCKISDDALLGQEGYALKTIIDILDQGRLQVAALSVGIANRLIEESVAYAVKRYQFGKPIADYQLIQAMMADSYAKTYAATCMIRETAKAMDAQEHVTDKTSCCKLLATEIVGQIADSALQIHGGAGYLQGSVVERLYRDVRLLRIYEGTNQIQQLIIAKSLMRKFRNRRNKK